jgi:hypothetical protein
MALTAAEERELAALEAREGVARYKGAPDLPLEEPFGIAPVDVSPVWRGAEALFGSTPQEQTTSAALALVPGSGLLANLAKGVGGRVTGGQLEGEPLSESVGTGAGAGATAWGAGKLLNWFLRGGFQKGADTKSVGKALEQTSPALGTPRTEADILAATAKRGSGQQAASAARDQAEKALSGSLPVTHPSAAGPLGPGGAHPRERLQALLQELADAGKAAFNEQGNVRDSAGSLVRLRSRDEIIRDIEQLLPPSLLPKFRAMQKDYAANMEAGRIARRAGLGTGKPFEMSKLQQAYRSRLGPARAALGKDNPLEDAIFRGGGPGETDQANALLKLLPLLNRVADSPAMRRYAGQPLTVSPIATAPAGAYPLAGPMAAWGLSDWLGNTASRIFDGLAPNSQRR